MARRKGRKQRGKISTNISTEESEVEAVEESKECDLPLLNEIMGCENETGDSEHASVSSKDASPAKQKVEEEAESVPSIRRSSRISRRLKGDILPFNVFVEESVTLQDKETVADDDKAVKSKCKTKEQSATSESPITKHPSSKLEEVNQFSGFVLSSSDRNDSLKSKAKLEELESPTTIHILSDTKGIEESLDCQSDKISQVSGGSSDIKKSENVVHAKSFVDSPKKAGNRLVVDLEIEDALLYNEFETENKDNTSGSKPVSNEAFSSKLNQTSFVKETTETSVDVQVDQKESSKDSQMENEFIVIDSVEEDKTVMDLQFQCNNSTLKSEVKFENEKETNKDKSKPIIILRDTINTNTASALNDISKTKAFDTSKDKRTVTELPNKKLNDSSDTFAKSTNQEVSKKKQNRIPGRSFIIGIRASPSESKRTMFDCVLCWNSKERCSVSGSIINGHIKSKEHALKVMEHENIDLYNLYKDDRTMPAERIVSAILNYEETQKRQSLVLATTENYAQKREAVQKRISAKKAALISPCSFSEIKGKAFPKASTPTVKEESNQNEMREQTSAVHRALSIELAEKQKGRTPKQILVVMDARDVFLGTNNIGKNVKVLRRKEMNFQNALQYLKNDNWFGKGTLYIFLCGIFSVVKSRSHYSCTRNSCKNPVSVFCVNKNMTPDYLITRALKLHKLILDETTNDQALFCDVIPINIDASNIAKLDKRICFSVHPVDACRKVPVNLTEMYMRIVSEYNAFTKIHSENMGFKFWDLLRNTLHLNTDDVSVAVQHIKGDGISFDEIDFNNRSVVISENTKELLMNMECQNANKDNSEEVKSTSSLASKQNAKKKDKVIIPPRCDLTEPLFEKVVIVANCLYKKVLSNFAGPKVEILADEDFNYDGFESVIKNKVKKMPPKTLWLTLIGSFCIFEIDKCKSCQHFKHPCAKPLASLVPNSDVRHLANTLGAIHKIRKSFLTLMKEVRTVLKPESAILIIPPFPPTVYSEDMFLHRTLHSLYSNDLHLYVASENIINHLNTVFTHMSKEMISLTIEELGKMNYPQKPILNYRSSLSENHMQIVRHVKEPKEYYINDWKKAISELILQFLSEKSDTKRDSLKESKEIVASVANEHDVIIVSEKNVTSFKDTSLKSNKNKAEKKANHCKYENEAESKDNNFKYNENKANRTEYTENNFKYNENKANRTEYTENNFKYNENKANRTEYTENNFKYNENKANRTEYTGNNFKYNENKANRTEYNGNKTNSTKCNESKASCASPKLITIGTEQYDHLAFIGCQEQLQQLPTLGKSNISLWNLKFPLDWNDMKTKFASLESLSKKNKLFVILADISMIAMEIYDSQCKVLKCKTSISYMTAGTSSLSALIEEKMESIKRLASKIKSHFPEGTEVILAPLCPRYCIKKPVIADEKLHGDLHEALEHDSKPCILEGAKNTWEKAILEFRMGWENEINSTLTNSNGKIKDLIKNYILKPKPLLEWKKPEKSSFNFKSFSNVHCQLFLKDLMEAVILSPKPEDKQMQQQQLQPQALLWQQQQKRQQQSQPQVYPWQQQQQQQQSQPQVYSWQQQPQQPQQQQPQQQQLQQQQLQQQQLQQQQPQQQQPQQQPPQQQPQQQQPQQQQTQPQLYPCQQQHQQQQQLQPQVYPWQQQQQSQPQVYAWQQQQQQQSQPQVYAWWQQQQQPLPNSCLPVPLMSTVSNSQNPQMSLEMQHQPVAMQYNTCKMETQQSNVYMNNSYGMYEMNQPHKQQQQQQQFLNQNFQPPTNTYSQEQQHQLPFHNNQSLQNNPPYSTPVTYEAATIAYKKPQVSPTLNQPNIDKKKQNDCISVAVAVPSASNSSATKNIKSRPEENTSSSIAVTEAEATQVFVDSLPELCNIVNKPNSSAFDHVFIIGKKELIHPLSELKLKNATLLYHNLSSVMEKDVPFLLSKIGNIPKKSVCFLAFSLSVITKTVPVSPSCRKFSCKQPIPVSNLKSQMEDGVVRPNSNIIKRIKELVAFISKLSDYVPAIVLPLFPSRVFCDDAETISKHRISHAISNRDSFVVMGKKEYWESNFTVFTRLWNNFINVNHDKYTSSELISKYTQVQKDTLIIKDHVNDFFTDYSDPTLWRAFLHTLLHALVTNSEVDSLINLGNKQRQRENATSHWKGGGSEASKPAETKLSSLLAADDAFFVPVLVKIWKSSQSVPDGFFNIFVKALESKAVVKKVEDYYTTELSKRSADLIVKKLNNCQIGDATIKACIVGKEDEVVSLSEVQENYVSSIFNQLYLQWKLTITENIKQSFSKELEIFKYKTRPCNVNCKGEIDKCTFYHNEHDRRRNLTSHNYIQKMCSYPKTALNLCTNGDSCIFSHNIYEQMFYPTNFQTILCPTLDGNKCLKQPFCKFAHKNTPEMFYISAWQDMVIFGIHNTFKFFTGALRGIAKLSSKKDVKVCLISPSTELLDIAEKAIVDILKDHQLKAIYLGKKWINPDFYQVFLGTPSVIANFQGQLLSPKSVGALIIDDINSILENPDDRNSLLNICQKLKITSNNPPVINKVIVATNYDPKITGVVSRFLRVPLTEVKETEGIKPPSVNDTPEAVGGGGGGQEKAEDELPNKSPSNKNGSLSLVRDRNNRRNSRSSRSRSRSHAESCHRRSRSRSRQRRSRSRTRRKLNSKSRQKRSRSPSPHSEMTQKKLKVYSPEPNTKLGNELANVTRPREKTKIITVELQKAGSRSLSNNVSLSQTLGEELYGTFLETEKVLYSTHGDEYEAFETFPELHSDYKVHYEEFASEYFRRYGINQGEKHKEHFWNEYWKVKFKKVKEDDWKKKREELVKEYEEKAKTLRLHKEKERLASVAPAVATTSVPKFSVEGTLNLLDQLSYKLGVLGPAIVAIVNLARGFGTNNNKVLSVFTDAENLVLINMVVDKLKALQNTAPETLIPTLVRAVDWIKQLLDRAKHPPKEVGLNLEAIAKASVGKDSAFVLNLIKTALAYEGLPPVTKEEINDLFLKVCSLHFNMAMEGK